MHFVLHTTYGFYRWSFDNHQLFLQESGEKVQCYESEQSKTSKVGEYKRGLQIFFIDTVSIFTFLSKNRINFACLNKGENSKFKTQVGACDLQTFFS